MKNIPFATKNNEDNIKINYQELKEFSEKDKKVIDYCYKGIVCTLIILNIVAIAFYIFYKIEIKSINKDNDSISKEIEIYESDNIRIQIENNKYFVNLFYSIEVNPSLITDNIFSKKEFDQLIQWTNKDSNKKWYMCYKTSYDGETSDHFIRDCSWGNNLIVVIRTDKGNRFGASISNYSQENTIITDPEAFLFNLDTLKKFPIKINQQSYMALSGGFFNFGNEDLVVYDNYNASAVSFSNFPNGNYGSNKDTLKDLIGENDNHFIIHELEIFFFDDDRYGS